MKIWRRKQFEADMDAELRLHIEVYVADLVRSGVSLEEAERRARVEFGSLEARKDECRSAWGLRRLDQLRADLRLAFRTIRRNPGLAAITVLSLALGIGANTAILRMLPNWHRSNCRSVSLKESRRLRPRFPSPSFAACHALPQ